MLTLLHNQPTMSEDVNIEEDVKPLHRINWTNEKILSVSALFISMISLIALIYQSYLAREENKLNQKQHSASVLPYLNQWQSDYDNTYRFIIGNKGVGPAFIEDVEINLNNTYKFDNSDDLFKHIFKNTKGLDTMPFSTSTLIKGFVLPANDKINILEIQYRNNSNFIRKALSSNDIKFKIVYKDVYGTKWMLSNDDDKSNSPQVPQLLED